jgi:PKD repeat protein
MAGVEIIPAVTNGLAKSYYTDLQPVTVFAKNTRPKITKPLAADLAATPLAPFNNVPMGVPFAFDWTVADVPADGPAMAVTWDFGDGIVKTVTGLVGTVSHTYASMGDKTVTVRATDKDGGVSDDITFKVTVIQTVSTPTFSPVSGTAVTNSLTVTFSCATPGTTIRYTLDGSEPTAASPLYTGAITLTQNATVKAKAFKAGYTDSATAPANYTVVQTVASPLISPATGVTFTNSLVITLTCATADASIRYTLDGTPPTASSVLYSKTIKISKNSVVLARAFKAGMVDSETAEANYFKEISLAEAINVTNAVITTGGQAMWAGLNLASSHDGVDAAQSGPIAHSQSTWMSTAVNGPGAFSFWWKSSCEDDPDHDDWDYVVFVVDGVEKLRLDGITEWQRVACTLGEGSHVIIWKYMKDESLSDGADCAWVDQCSFVPGLPTATTTTPVPVPFAWLERYPDLLRMTGGDHEVAALVDPDLDGMPTWREYVAGSDPMDRDSVFRSLIMVSNGVPRLTWTPDLGTVRVYSVEGRTNLSAGAWGPTNAGSRFFRVKVGMP